MRINVSKDWAVFFEERPEAGQVLAWLCRGRETYLGGNWVFPAGVRSAEFRHLEGSRAQVALEIAGCGSFLLCLDFDNPGEAWIF